MARAGSGLQCWRNWVRKVNAKKIGGEFECVLEPTSPPLHERDNGGDIFACHDNGDVDLLFGANGIDAFLQRMVEDALVKED